MMSTKVIIRWHPVDGLVRYRVKFWVFFSIRRPNRTPQKELKSFKFANVMYY